jgi:hypothetical protein
MLPAAWKTAGRSNLRTVTDTYRAGVGATGLYGMGDRTYHYPVGLSHGAHLLSERRERHREGSRAMGLLRPRTPPA